MKIFADRGTDREEFSRLPRARVELYVVQVGLFSMI